jgi:hypothetical protein
MVPCMAGPTGTKYNRSLLSDSSTAAQHSVMASQSSLASSQGPHLQAASCRHHTLRAPQVTVQGPTGACQLHTAALEAEGAWAIITQMDLAHNQVVARDSNSTGITKADASGAATTTPLLDT